MVLCWFGLFGRFRDNTFSLILFAYVGSSFFPKTWSGAPGPAAPLNDNRDQIK